MGYSSMRNHDPSPVVTSLRHLITVPSDAVPGEAQAGPGLGHGLEHQAITVDVSAVDIGITVVVYHRRSVLAVLGAQPDTQCSCHFRTKVPSARNWSCS